MTLGLCITPDFYPTTEEQKELKAPYYRSILYSTADVYQLLELNVPLILTVNNQCQEVHGDWSGWNQAIYNLMEILKEQNALNKLLVLGCGNELDLYWNENGSVPPAFGADIARRAKRIAKNYGVMVSATSLAGPRWPEYLQTLSELLHDDDDIDFYDVHPYGQRPNGWKDGQKWMHGDLQEIIFSARAISGHHEIICSEYGVKIGDAGSAQEVSKFLTAADSSLEQLDVPYKCWFAYHDLVGRPDERGQNAFGLMSTSMQKRPAWNAFSQVNKDVRTLDEIEDILEKWREKVGKGLLEMMKADQTEPAMSSEWRPFDRPSGTPATIEFCIGLNNVQYFYNLNTDSGWRVRPF